jgi:hypothetical protein
MNSDVLVMDIESRTFGKPDADKDRLRIFGCYSYKTNKVYLLTKKEDIQKIIDNHKFLVGFNNVGSKQEPGYDNPILIREGINLKYKIIIDLKNIFKERASQMKIKEGMLHDLLMEYSLDFITRTLGIVDSNTAKKDIDYKLFQKDTWTKEETSEILQYTKRDIQVTKALYDWTEAYFEGFKDFLTEEDVAKKVYLTSSIARFAYKAICKAMKWEEEYNNNGDDGDRISGGYVSYPAGEKFEGDIYLLDVQSLYPHIIMQCNLYGRKTEGIIDDRPIWSGGNKWKVEGRYYSDELNGVCKLFKHWYNARNELKKIGDKREYTLKIILNASYGAMNNAYYMRVFDRVAGGDCTRLGRQWIKYARKRFREAGYIICCSDTDSIYMVDTFKDKQKLLDLKDKIIEEIKSTVPFPQDSFNMALDAEIKYLYFFKGKNTDDKDTDIEMDEQDFIDKPKGFMKKNYLFVTKDDKVVIKNLGINKKSNSALSKKIFWDYLVPQIRQGQIKFSKTYIRNIILELLEKDFTLATMRKEVGNPEQYIKAPTALPAQIAQRYSGGIHFLIPNLKNIGVGKGKSFCTVEEFKQHNLKISDIDLDNVWSELGYFIKEAPKVDIFSFEVK